MTGSHVGDLPVGQTFTVRKTVSEADILGFAALTGDFDRLHVAAEYCRTTRYGRQIAHGALRALWTNGVSGR